MTATAVQVSQQAGVGDKEWVRLFPKEVTENYTSSITFIKQLTVVAVSTITYLKNAFPEDSYDTETFGGLKMKLLKTRCKDELAQFVSTSMRQAFDAFDRKYVHQLALCFYSGACSADNLIEYHVFEYSYSADGVQLTINSKNQERAKQTLRCSVEAVRRRTAILVRTLSMFVLQNSQSELPHSYDVSLRLYYNDDAPEDYQAPGFSPTVEPDHLASTAHEAVCLGSVQTPFHTLIARSFLRDIASDSDAAVPSSNQPEMTQDGSEAEGYGEWPLLRCPCGGADQDELVTCQYCHTQQHAVCFGLLAPTPEHCCAACADQEQDRTPSCSLLVGLEPRKQECLCIFRRALALCARLPALSSLELRARLGLGEATARKVLRLLQGHDVLPQEDTHDVTSPRKINPIRLKLAFKRFFRTEDEEDSTVERLVAETESHATASLESGPDAAAAADGADRTLLQYRAALTARARAASDETPPPPPPLGGAHNPVAAERIVRKPKRKADDIEEWQPTKLPKLRSGAKTKNNL